MGEQSIWLNVAPQEENLLTYDVNQNVGKNMTEQDEGILDDVLKALEKIFARRRLSQLTRFKNEIVKIDEIRLFFVNFVYILALFVTLLYESE